MHRSYDPPDGQARENLRSGVVVQSIPRVAGQKRPEDKPEREGIAGYAGGRGTAMAVGETKGEVVMDAG